MKLSDLGDIELVRATIILEAGGEPFLGKLAVASVIRERLTDIPLLLQHYLGRFSRGLSKNVTAISPAALDMLVNHHWPGNIRELRNALERAVVGALKYEIHNPVCFWLRLLLAV